MNALLVLIQIVTNGQLAKPASTAEKATLLQQLISELAESDTSEAELILAKKFLPVWKMLTAPDMADFFVRHPEMLAPLVDHVVRFYPSVGSIYDGVRNYLVRLGGLTNVEGNRLGLAHIQLLQALQSRFQGGAKYASGQIGNVLYSGIGVIGGKKSKDHNTVQMVYLNDESESANEFDKKLPHANPISSFGIKLDGKRLLYHPANIVRDTDAIRLMALLGEPSKIQRETPPQFDRNPSWASKNEEYSQLGWEIHQMGGQFYKRPVRRFLMNPEILTGSDRLRIPRGRESEALWMMVSPLGHSPFLNWAYYEITLHAESAHPLRLVVAACINYSDLLEKGEELRAITRERNTFLDEAEKRKDFFEKLSAAIDRLPRQQRENYFEEWDWTAVSERIVDVYRQAPGAYRRYFGGASPRELSRKEITAGVERMLKSPNRSIDPILLSYFSQLEGFLPIPRMNHAVLTRAGSKWLATKTMELMKGRDAEAMPAEIRNLAEATSGENYRKAWQEFIVWLAKPLMYENFADEFFQALSPVDQERLMITLAHVSVGANEPNVSHLPALKILFNHLYLTDQKKDTILVPVNIEGLDGVRTSWMGMTQKTVRGVYESLKVLPGFPGKTPSEIQINRAGEFQPLSFNFAEGLKEELKPNDNLTMLFRLPALTMPRTVAWAQYFGLRSEAAIKWFALVWEMPRFLLETPLLYVPLYFSHKFKAGDKWAGAGGLFLIWTYTNLTTALALWLAPDSKWIAAVVWVIAYVITHGLWLLMSDIDIPERRVESPKEKLAPYSLKGGGLVTGIRFGKDTMVAVGFSGQEAIEIRSTAAGLTITSLREKTQAYLLRPGENFTIGRSADNHFHPANVQMSQHHTFLAYGLDKTLTVRDLKSMNGTTMIVVNEVSPPHVVEADSEQHAKYANMNVTPRQIDLIDRAKQEVAKENATSATVLKALFPKAQKLGVDFQNEPLHNTLPFYEMVDRKGPAFTGAWSTLVGEKSHAEDAALFMRALAGTAQANAKRMAELRGKMKTYDHAFVIVESAAVKEEFEHVYGANTQMEFLVNDDKLDLFAFYEVENVRSKFKKVHVLASAQMPFSAQGLSSLRHLQSALPDALAIYLLSDVLGQTAVRVSVQDLLEFARFRDHLIATQA